MAHALAFMSPELTSALTETHDSDGAVTHGCLFWVSNRTCQAHTPEGTCARCCCLSTAPFHHHGEDAGLPPLDAILQMCCGHTQGVMLSSTREVSPAFSALC